MVEHQGQADAQRVKLFRDGDSTEQLPKSCALGKTNQESEIVFRSAVMETTIEQAKRFAECHATILLCGESGTGKELFASLIHNYSSRRDKIFVRVNCAALSESLIESELFGHEKGAFTGAGDAHSGRFEWANGGTLLLDEISEIPLSIQAKLLRVLEANEFQRVGCNSTRIADVRIIATSNRDLSAEVAANRFRADLFHRLNVLQITIPPLRARPEDIAILAQTFLNSYRHESRGNLTGISPSATDKLTGHDWPGNVRQLRNVMNRACVLATGRQIEEHDIPNFGHSVETQLPSWLLDLSLEEIQRRVILETLQKHGGNKTQTARKLGITVRTILNKVKCYQAQGLMRKAS